MFSRHKQLSVFTDVTFLPVNMIIIMGIIIQYVNSIQYVCFFVEFKMSKLLKAAKIYIDVSVS